MQECSGGAHLLQKSAITVVDRTSGYVDYTAYVLTQTRYEKNKIF